MMRTAKTIMFFLFFLALMSLSPQVLQAQSPIETLNQYVSDLQKNPNDYALREKIIKHVQTMRPAPAIPEDARRHYVMAKTLFEGAKKTEDFSDSIAEFKSALLVAPWWPEANRDLGLALEAAQRYNEAITYVKLYMATSPGDERTRAAQDEIYKIEAKKQLAAKQKNEDEAKKSAEKARVRAEAEARARLESVEGTWHLLINLGGTLYRSSNDIFRISRGNDGGWKIDFPGSRRKDYAYDIRQSGRGISFTRMCSGCDPALNTGYFSLSLSADGNRLVGTLRTISIGGNVPHWVTEEEQLIRESAPWSGPTTN